MRTIWSINSATLITFIAFGLMLPSMSAAGEGLKAPGLIEVDCPEAGEAKVSLNLSGGIFSLAAKITKEENPEASEFLANLEAVKVRIYDRVALGEKKSGEVLEFYEKQLKKGKWDLVARVKEKDSKLSVHLLTKGDIVSGLVVLIGNTKEFIIANLTGRIDITKLPQIDEITGVKLNLKELDFKKRPLSNKERK